MKRATTVLVVTLGLAAATVFAFQNRGVRHAVSATVASVTPAREITVPRGTMITVRLEDRLGTSASRAGDPFMAMVESPVSVGDDVVIPSGAEVAGNVLVAEPAGHISGHGRLQLRYASLRIGDEHYPLDSRSLMYESASSARRSTGLIGGGAVLGGLIGGIAGGSGGSAVKGAVVGGAAGTAASAMSPAPQLLFEPGTLLRFALDQDVAIRVRPA